MGARHASCDSCLSCIRTQSDYISYKRGTRKIHNPEILDSMVPTTEVGLEGNILLDAGKWRKHQMQHICPLISEWNVRQGLWIGWNNQPTIITQIAGIKFQFMQCLSLDRNSIYSIELLSEIWMPNLIELNLQHNNIVRLRPLVKLPQLLEKLHINHNSANDVGENLHYLQTKNLTTFHYDTYVNDVTKLQSNSLQIIWIKRFLTPYQRNVLDKTREKRQNSIQVRYSIDP